MPLISFENNLPHAVRAGDVVGYAVDRAADGTYSRREFVHVGVVVRDGPRVALDYPISVYHMGNDVVRHDDWSWERGAHPSPIADFLGVHHEIEDALRTVIVDFASSMFGRFPSGSEGKFKFYWQGAPSLTSHPRYPTESHAYALSCATFVNACYETAFDGGLVDSDSLPDMSDADYAALRTRIGARNIETGPFKRLDACFILAAFHENQTPLASANWQQYRENNGPVFTRFHIA